MLSLVHPATIFDTMVGNVDIPMIKLLNRSLAIIDPDIEFEACGAWFGSTWRRFSKRETKSWHSQA